MPAAVEGRAVPGAARVDGPSEAWSQAGAVDGVDDSGSNGDGSVVITYIEAAAATTTVASSTTTTVAGTAGQTPTTTTTVPAATPLAFTGLSVWPLLGSSLAFIATGWACVWFARKRGRHARA